MSRLPLSILLSADAIALATSPLAVTPTIKFVAPDTVCFCRVEGRYSLAPESVRSVVNLLKMGRIHTTSDAAEVVELERGIQMADKEMIGKTVSLPIFTADFKASVAVGIEAAKP